MVKEICKFSPAKINLYLEVKNKRNDGFHNIESLMTFCDYGDLISVRRSNSFKFKINGPFSETLINRENLIERTVKELEILYKRKFLVSIHLKKNLPISSGMGGGSSNSATIIRCIKEIFSLTEPRFFKKFLLSLGADVPFCYYGKTAIVTGIGENVTFVDDIKEFYILLINPKIEIIATFPGRGKTPSIIIKNTDKTQATTITARPVAQTCNEKTSIDIINELDELILLMICMISLFRVLFRPYPNIQSIMQS